MDKDFKINNQVLVKHSILHLDLKAPFGYALLQKFDGVPIFFAISGYLISASFERNDSLKHYVANRALRIYPGLWGCILLTIVAATLVGGIDFVNQQAPVWLLTQLAGIIYTPGFLTGFGFGSYNGSLWTIPVELQFYMLLPVLYFLVKKINKPWFTFVSVWVVFMVLACVIDFSFPDIGDRGEDRITKIVRYTFLPHFHLFLTGVVFQRFKLYESGLIYGKGLYWLAAYLVFCFCIPYSELQFFASNLFLAITSLSLAYTRPILGKTILGGNDISYGVYMYHGLVLNVMVESGLVGRYGYVLVVLEASYLLGFLSWRCIEKPFLKIKQANRLKTAA